MVCFLGWLVGWVFLFVCFCLFVVVVVLGRGVGWLAGFYLILFCYVVVLEGGGGSVNILSNG